MKSFHCTALAGALAMPLLAAAQSAASASAPTSGPRSPTAFTDYKPYRDIPAGNWRAMNDTVRDAGGPMAHGMAMPPAITASAPASAPAKAAPKAPAKAHVDHPMPGGMK